MKTHTALSLFVAGAGLAIGAHAQQSRTLQGELDRPLVAVGAPAAQPAHMFLSKSDSNGTYEVEIRGEDVSAKVNGKSVPSDRVRRSDGKIELLSENGDVLATFNVSTAAAPRASRARSAPVAPARPSAPQWQGVAPAAPQALEGLAFAMAADQPKTMIGIRMDDEAEGEVVLTDVIKGLPADRAGLRAGDVLVKIAGARIEKVTDIRETLKDKNPGDKVEVIVKREGAEKTFEVTLDAYETAKLRGDMEPMEFEELANAFAAVGADGTKLADDARAALEKALREISQSKAKADFQESWSQAMEQAIKALEHNKNEAAVWLRGFAAPTPTSRQNVIVEPGQGRVFRIPAPTPMPPGAFDQQGLDERLERLADQIERLNERLDRMTEKLEKKNP